MPNITKICLKPCTKNVPKYASNMCHNIHESYTKYMPQSYTILLMICLNHVPKYVSQAYTISSKMCLKYVPKHPIYIPQPYASNHVRKSSKTCLNNVPRHVPKHPRYVSNHIPQACAKH
jgi:hypothetical protein